MGLPVTWQVRVRRSFEALASAVIAALVTSVFVQPAIAASPGSIAAIAPCLAAPAGLAVAATEGSAVAATLVTFGAPTQDQLFVAQLYLDLLKRAPTCTELQSLIQALSGGATTAQVAATLVNASDYLKAEVTSFYSSLLGRSPTATELANALTAMQSGATEAQIQATIIGSPEYALLYSTSDALVVGIYQDLLGRSPSSSELAFGVAVVTSLGAGSLAQTILLGSEYGAATTNNLFSALLGRTPTATELSFYIGKLGSGTALRLVVADIAGSSDYFNNQSPPTFSATVDWGDGTPIHSALLRQTSDGYSVSGTHTYVEEGAYTIVVVVTASIGSSFSVVASATVSDAPLTATGVSVSLSAGASSESRPVVAGRPTGNVKVANLADFNPGGTASDFTARIDWGDGTTPTPGTVTAGVGGGFSVAGGHTYTARGDYGITVVITDDGGSQAAAVSTVSVLGRP